MATLEAALEHALGGDGRVVGVVGEGGVGKSRLCFEFLERCQARGLTTYRASSPVANNSGSLSPVPS